MRKYSTKNDIYYSLFAANSALDEAKPFLCEETKPSLAEAHVLVSKAHTLVSNAQALVSKAHASLSNDPLSVSIPITQVRNSLDKIKELTRKNKRLDTKINILEKKVEQTKRDAKFPGALSLSYLRDWFNNTLQQLSPRELSGRIPRDRKITILMIDCDSFGSVNKEFNLTVGDRMIRQTVKEIKSQIKSKDLLFRWGGDEFLIVLSGRQTNKSLEQAVSRLNQMVVRIQVGKVEVSRTVSVSGKLFTLTHKTRISRLSEIERELSIANNKVKERKKNPSPNP